MFTDSHSHIQFGRDFPDLDAVISRAESAGVTTQFMISCSPKDSFQLPAFLDRYPDKRFFGCIGVHPHDADKLNNNVLNDFVSLLSKNKKIVGLGEIGLDYFRNMQPRELQKKVFELQLNSAKDLDLPVVIHVREALEDVMKSILDNGIKKVIFHSFDGGKDFAYKCWNEGFYTSFSGMLTYPKNEELRRVVAEAPKELILIETDCPYLPPQKFRGQRNEPAYVVEIAKEIANIRNIDVDEVGKITSENALRAFGLMPG